MRIGAAAITSAALAIMLLLASLQQTQTVLAAGAVSISQLNANQGIASGALVDSPVFLSVTLGNENDFEQPFVTVFEVRNAEGSTVFLKLDAGALAPSGQQTSRVFWVPGAAGEYSARVFAMSGIGDQPEILSAIQSAPLAVQDPPASQSSPPETYFSLNKVASGSELYQLRKYALDRINEDREKSGLAPVGLSQNLAAQVHAEEILKTKVASHWTTGGEKPYMLFAKYGGSGMVTQNIGLTGSSQHSADCASGAHPCDAIDPIEQIDLHQYGMVHADGECCGNEHRDNILGPHHTDVSIGIAYDDYAFVIVQNFEDNYVDLDGPLSERAGHVTIAGDIPRGRISAISVFYDPAPSAAVYEQNKDRASYGMGELVAAVVEPGSNSTASAPVQVVVVADRWNVVQQVVDISFSITPIVEKRGMYTVVVTFEDTDGDEFPVLSYSMPA